MKYIGWSKGNTVSFIAATTLARHKLKTLGVKLKPFTYGVYTLVPLVKKVGSCYLIGSFEGGEIDALLSINAKVTIIGKIYDKKYDVDRKRRIGSIIIYPVPKTDKLGGLEYLTTLITYFNVSEEAKFFEAMMSRKYALARVLSITDAWIPAYELFTTFEVVDDPTPSDIDRVVDYLKKRYGYDELYKRFAEELKNRVIFENGGAVVADLGTKDPKRYMFVAQDVFPNRRAILLVSRVPEAVVYRILVVCNGKCSSEAKRRLAEALNAECRGGSRRFTIRVSMERDVRSIAKAVAEVLL